MRQRLGLAAALVRVPQLLVLDEPSNGLDPRGIRDIRDLLIELNEAGTTVFLSSHLLSEVEQLCTTVGILDHGRLVAQEKLSALQAPTGRVVVSSPDADRVAALLDGRVETRDGAELVVREDDAAALNARLVGEGVRVAEIRPERRSLEQLMLELTSEGSDQVGSPRRKSAAQTPGYLGTDETPPGVGADQISLGRKPDDTSHQRTGQETPLRSSAQETGQ